MAPRPLAGNQGYDLLKSEAGAIMRRNGPQVKVFDGFATQIYENAAKGGRPEAVTKLIASAKGDSVIPLSLLRRRRAGYQIPPLRGWSRVCPTGTLFHRVS